MSFKQVIPKYDLLHDGFCVPAWPTVTNNQQCLEIEIANRKFRYSLNKIGILLYIQIGWACRPVSERQESILIKSMNNLYLLVLNHHCVVVGFSFPKLTFQQP
jgi:hypothetical protein